MQKRASDQLISENRELNSYKRSVLILEQEKRELETKLNTYRESSQATIRSTDDENMDDMRSQVDFLNSVIVDMQRKNDEMKAKMELFESAGILETIGKALI